MTVQDREALEALRRRLSHAEAICNLLTDQDTSEMGEAMRGVALLIEDGTAAIDRILEAQEDAA